jgi:hypothetical protein
MARTMVGGKPFLCVMGRNIIGKCTNCSSWVGGAATNAKITGFAPQDSSAAQSRAEQQHRYVLDSVLDTDCAVMSISFPFCSGTKSVCYSAIVTLRAVLAKD